MTTGITSAFSAAATTHAAASDLIARFRFVDATAIVFFAPARLDGAEIARALRAAHPSAAVIGCTSAGVFSEREAGIDAVSAIALPRSKVRACAAALASLAGGAAKGIREASRALEAQLGIDLREADPRRYVGVVLVDGLHMHEEQVNEALGNVAPLLSFVGGSAGDELAFEETRVFVNGAASAEGAALLLLDMAAPFTIAKTCSFEPAGARFVITRAERETRTVYELDGRPVLDVYARAIGVPVSRLDRDVFMAHPLGLMIVGEPWIRSPQRVTEDAGLRFYCEILEGMEVEVMRATDLVADTRRALAGSAETLGGVSGALLFNCILRRLEIDAKGLQRPFLETFRSFPTAGFHTYGESWLGHINQTLTGLLIG